MNLDENDRSLDHLRDDAPYSVCSGCGRKSWGGDGDVAGETCLMRQPSGGRCQGVFGVPVVPASTEEDS